MSTLSNYADTIKITIKILKNNLTNIFYIITINYIFKKTKGERYEQTSNV